MHHEEAALASDAEIGNDAYDERDTGVCETNTPFVRAFAMQYFSRNCSPAPDLVL